MSNSFSSSPQLVDPGRVSASQTIRTTEASRLGDLQNYAFANGGSHDVVNQLWDAEVLRINSATKVQVCEWYIPRPSNIHNTFKFRVAAHTTKANATVECEIFFPLSGNSYAASTIVTDGARYATQFDELTVNITASENELFAVCRFYVTSIAITHYVEVASVCGRWSPSTSPLATGALAQGSDEFIPVGASRLGADLPLPARFGVQTLSNIEILRKRGRTLFNWSGSSNTMTGHNAPVGLGIFDQQVMYSNVALFAGMNQINLDVDVFINIANYVSGKSYDIFGHQLTPIQNGWSSFGLNLRLNELQISDQFNMSMYQVGLENTTRNTETLLSQNYKQTNSAMYIKGLSIIGV
jgi:hypothetical protein